jgi:predicted acyl esterase
MREQSVVADGMRIDWDVPIEMDDGIVLRADVFRPIPEGQYPVIITYGPYGKGLPTQVHYAGVWKQMCEWLPEIAEGSTNRYQSWEIVDPEKWVPHEYVVVRVDSRGAGRSPGVIDIFSARETRDFHDCIEWAGTQPWSNGKVGISGISYFAMNAWHVAAQQPPHLAAMIPWEGAADFYRDFTRHGGISMGFFWAQWYRNQARPVQHGMGERSYLNPNSGMFAAGPETLSEEELARNRVDINALILAHPLDDEFYRQRSPDWSKVTVPLLSAANWGGQGLHPRGNHEGFMRAASKQKWLECHGLDHTTLFFGEYGRELQKRFFDRFLKDIDNGWDDVPPVTLQVRHVDRFVQREEHEWPLARTEWTKLYLDPATRMLRWREVGEESQVVYQALSDGETFVTAPFGEETEITGPIALKLFLASSTSDADVFPTVRLFDPAGKEVDFQGTVDPHTPIAQGWLRASHRKLDPELTLPYRPYHSHDEIQPLVKGQVYELDVELWPTCIVVPAGYRLGLTLRGQDFERPGPGGTHDVMTRPLRGSGPFLHNDPEDRPPEIFDNTHTVFGGGEHGSYLLLPLIPRK